MTELTSGERFLIGLLGIKIISNRINPLVQFNPDQVVMDFTKVESITVYLYYSSNDEIATNWGPIRKKTSTTLPYNGANYLYFDGRNNDGMEFAITSFTTTDGKVHTADNLNY